MVVDKKVVRYVFGIGSSVSELLAKDFTVAKISMALFYKTTAPIAIYEPFKEVIHPKIVLANDPDFVESIKDDLIECMESIKEVNV